MVSDSSSADSAKRRVWVWFQILRIGGRFGAVWVWFQILQIGGLGFGLVSDSAVDSLKRRGLALDLLATAHSGGASSREPVILFLFLTV